MIERIEVIKRNGNRVPWEASRIQTAIEKAAKASGQNEHDARATSISSYAFVLDKISNAVEIPTIDDMPEGFTLTISVEEIQDIVEGVLIEHKLISIARCYIAYRDLRSELRDTEVPKGAIAQYVEYSKYVRETDKNWSGAVKRLFDMHRRKYTELLIHIETIESATRSLVTLDDLEDIVADKLVLPSMRSVQFGGAAIEQQNMRMYNCAFSTIESWNIIPQAFYLLLCGCGVGYSVEQRYVSKLPKLHKPIVESINFFPIDDSIIGWADALEMLISSYLLPGRSYVEFKYNIIRPRGAELKTSGGKAPGHIPLKVMLERVRTILDSVTGRKVKPIEVHKIMCLTAEAVLSGGIRRSSLMAMFSTIDMEMMLAKTGDWMNTNPEFRMANNSAVNPTLADIDSILEMSKQYGEPGFVFAEEGFGFNPCGEIYIRSEGRFGFCNLTEVDVTQCKTPNAFLFAVQIAAYIGTLQAGYTNSPFDIGTLEEDALIGVSLTGIMDTDGWLMPTKFPGTLADQPHNPLLRKAAHLVREVNWQVASAIGIKHAKRCTTIKPSGTASLLLGGISSGLHPHHAKRYIRRVIAKDNEPAFIAYKAANPEACLQMPNGDWVIEFAMGTDGVTIADLSAYEMLKLQAYVYREWVTYGNTTLEMDNCHNISFTVPVKEDEWDDVKDFYSYMHSSLYKPKATSFFPASGDTVYPFAPREAVKTTTQMARWMRLAKTYKQPEYGYAYTSEFGAACEGPSCEYDPDDPPF